jgi:hypothetical protein
MSHCACHYSLLSTCGLVCLALSNIAFGVTGPDRTSFGHNISIGANETAGELTCFGCSIHVRGAVAGDVTAFFGSVVIEDHGQVNGEVTVFGADLRMDEAVKIAGDATVLGGEIRRGPQAIIQGEETVFAGRGWAVAILLLPFVIVGLLIALVVWLIQRSRRPSIPPLPA